MEEVNVNQVEMFLSKLEERATDLVELAEKVKAESSTQDIIAYRPFRDRVDDFGSSQKSVKTLIPAQSDELHCWSQDKAHGHRRPL